MAHYDPFYSADASPGGSSPSEESLARLQWDLSNIGGSGPSLHPDLRRNLIARLEAEPARVETDREGHITSINPAFTQLCGYTFPEIEGKRPGHFLQGPDTEPQAVETLRAALKDAQTAEVDIVNYHKDGSPYRVAIKMEPVTNEAGEVIGFRAVAVKIPLA